MQQNMTAVVLCTFITSPKHCAKEIQWVS